MNKHIKESLKLYANQLSPMTENSANLWKTLDFTLAYSKMLSYT